MNSIKNSSARAVADVAGGLILATVDVAAPPERVFNALTSKEVCDWWLRPGVFDTREWTADVRVGGHWRASGVGNGRPYSLEGEFLEVDPARKLVQTWNVVGLSGEPSRVTYLLEALVSGTRITLRHSGAMTPAVCSNTAIGWETSFERLEEILSAS